MSSCILHQGYCEPRMGYGRCFVMRYGKRIQLAHVRAWIDTHKRLPPEDKPHILHTCNNPPCINPEHLYAGTEADNAKDRDYSNRNGQSVKTHCPQNHPYDEENTYVNPQGHRQCRTCMRGGSMIRCGGQR